MASNTSSKVTNIGQAQYNRAEEGKTANMATTGIDQSCVTELLLYCTFAAIGKA